MRVIRLYDERVGFLGMAPVSNVVGRSFVLYLEFSGDQPMDSTAEIAKRVCIHLLESKDLDYHRRFTGNGLDYDLLCSKCKSAAVDIETNLRVVSPEFFKEIEQEGCWDGIIGEPEIRSRATNLYFEHETHRLLELASIQFLDIQPVVSLPNVWLAVSSDGILFRVDLNKDSVWSGPSLPGGLIDLQEKAMLRTTRDGELAVVANARGQHGAVLDVKSGHVTMLLDRGNYHEDVSTFSVAFIDSDKQTLLIHGTAWNRLDVSDARTGKQLTERSPTSYKQGEDRPPHYLDYFHCGLSVSPSQQFIADNGWVWHPSGIVTTWSVPRWLEENVWESEDGPSKKHLCHRAYYWDGPVCWIDDQHLVVGGYGADDEWLIPAACIFDVSTGKQVRWFPGPKGAMIFDTHLYSWSEDGISAWDVSTGERLATDNDLVPVSYHPGSKCFLTVLGDGNFRLSRLASRPESHR